MRQLAFEDFVLSSHNLHIENSFLPIGDTIYETWKDKNESKNVLSALFGTCLSCSVSFQVTTYTHTHTHHINTHTHTQIPRHSCMYAYSLSLSLYLTIFGGRQSHGRAFGRGHFLLLLWAKFSPGQ